jgi:signal transduction histidine kinase
MFHSKFLQQYNWFLAVAVISLLALLLCIFAASQLWYRIENDTRRETSNVTHLLVNHFDSIVENTDGLLRTIIFDMNASIDTEETDKGLRLNQLLKRHWPKVPSPFGILAISDKNGIVLATNRDYSGQSFDVSQGDSFRFHSAAAVNDQSLYISTPVKGRISGFPVVLFSRALRKSNGAFDGMVEASYKLESFTASISNLDIKNVGIVGLAGRDGIVRVRSLYGVISFGDNVAPNAPVFGNILRGETEGAYDSKSPVDQKRRVGFFAISKNSQMYVYVGYDYKYLVSEYNRTIIFFGIFWVVFSAATFVAVFLFWKAELLSRQRQFELSEASASERQRILTQMHDSVGASVTSLIGQLSREVNWKGAKDKANQIRTELRLLVDSIFVDTVDLVSVIAGVRHRMQGGFGPEGIKAVWKIAELPKVPQLSALCVLHLRLMIMESLSNVLLHSKARAVIVSAAYDNATGFVTINIADDGIGFEFPTSSSGRGLANLKMRAAKMLLPTTVNIETKPGNGTTVQINIKWPAEV